VKRPGIKQDDGQLERMAGTTIAEMIPVCTEFMFVFHFVLFTAPHAYSNNQQEHNSFDHPFVHSA
jgi:hypothetical protein